VLRLFNISLFTLWLSASALANTIVAYVEAPGIQASSLSNITTTNFDNVPTGYYSSPLVTAIGTYEASPSNQFRILGADQYGGAGGTGNYFAVGSESGSPGPIVLNLTSNANYFGFWWSAGDINNSISFYENGVLYATFNTADIVSLLPNSPSGTVTAINGSTYNTKNYYGNPNNSSQDTSEPFAYVDVIANGLMFNEVTFSNTLNTGFESDNHSVSVGVTDPPVGDVIVEDVPLTPAAQAPEPGTAGLLIAALGGLGLFKFRRSAAKQ
jgi:PEP-CTERM motif